MGKSCTVGAGQARVLGRWQGPVENQVSPARVMTGPGNRRIRTQTVAPATRPPMTATGASQRGGETVMRSFRSRLLFLSILALANTLVVSPASAQKKPG